MGAQDAQVVPVHPAQVCHCDHRVDAGVQPHGRPEAFHIRIIRIAGAVDRVVEGIVDHGRTKISAGGIGHLLQIDRGHLGEGHSSVFLLRVIHEDAALHTAAVGEADHAVRFVYVDRAHRNKALFRQLLELGLCGGKALGAGERSKIAAVRQGRNGAVRLLHLGRILAGQGVGNGQVVRPGCQCGSGEEGSEQKAQCAERR